MKNILHLFCAVLAFASSGLLAQENPDSLVANGDSSSEVRHVAARFVPCPVPDYDAGPCPIGDKKHPVTADEYTDFLNMMAFKDHSWFSSDYYEISYMVTDQDWLDFSNATIRRTGQNPPYQYSVMPGHETDIIDSVSYAETQYMFQEWRKDPAGQGVWEHILQ